MKSLLLALVLAFASQAAQPHSASPPASQVEGQYDAGGTPLYLVAEDDALYAVIGDAVYPLARDAEGQLRNGAGAEVSFVYDGAGALIEARDGSGEYRFLSSEVPSRIRALLRPLPRGQAWTYSPPTDEDADLPSGDAETAGLPHAQLARLIGLIAEDPEWSGVHSLLVLRHDHLVLESYFYGFTADEAHDLRSATKSVHGALAGIAVRAGLLSLDMPVWSRLASHYGVDVVGTPATVTLSQALDMQTGLACDDFDETSPARELVMMEREDWTRFLLNAPAAPIQEGTGHYCSAAPVAIGRLIEHETGEPLPAFAQRELFAPVGITDSGHRWDFRDTWLGPNHVAGLYMTPRDMVRFGRLYLEDGVADGHRVLPEGWVDASFAGEVAVGSWRRYGRFWWTLPVTDELLGPARTFTVHAAMGNGGQRIVVVPQYDAVIVLTGGNYNDRTPTDRIIAYLVRLMDEHAATD